MPKRDTDEHRRLGTAPPPPEGLQPEQPPLHPGSQRGGGGDGDGGSDGRPLTAGGEGEGGITPDGGAVIGSTAKNVGAKALVVAWWGDRDIGILARALATFAPRGSRISVVAQAKPDVRGNARPACGRRLCALPACEAQAIMVHVHLNGREVGGLHCWTAIRSHPGWP